MKNEKPQSKMTQSVTLSEAKGLSHKIPRFARNDSLLSFLIVSSIAGSIFLFPPLISHAAIAITPPDHFVGDGTLGGGTASLIKINIIDEEPGVYYLKAYFYPSSKTQARFGYVWNPTTNRWASAWQKNSEQLQIEVVPGKEWNGVPVRGLWQGEISVKTDTEKSGYLGRGEYILKVRVTPVATGHAIEISMKTSIVEPSAISGGTPKAINSQSTTSPVIPSDSEESHPSETPEQHSAGDSSAAPPLQNDDGLTKPATQSELKLQIIEYPKNIFINEVLPAPEGADEQNEWIEIANTNNFAVDLAKWRLKDTVGSIKIYTFPEKSIVPANGFLVAPRTESKIALQNSGDGLKLFNPREEVADKMEFPKAPNNQSYNRGASNWQWSKILTPGLPNQISAANQSLEQNKSVANNLSTTSDSRLLANIGLNANKKSGPASRPHWPTIFSFIIGLTVAAASTAGALYFKKGQITKAKIKAKVKTKSLPI